MNSHRIKIIFLNYKFLAKFIEKLIHNTKSLHSQEYQQVSNFFQFFILKNFYNMIFEVYDIDIITVVYSDYCI